MPAEPSSCVKTLCHCQSHMVYVRWRSPLTAVAKLQHAGVTLVPTSGWRTLMTQWAFLELDSSPLSCDADVADVGGGGGGRGLPTMDSDEPLFRGKVVDLDKPRLSFGISAGGALNLKYKVSSSSWGSGCSKAVGPCDPNDPEVMGSNLYRVLTFFPCKRADYILPSFLFPLNH